MIPQSFIQELLARIDVVDVVGRYVQLKKGGINYMGLCPFHNEKSPSFTVSQSKQFYHCFGCGANGSAVGFLMEHLGLSFVEAVRQLAQEIGVTVPEEKRELSAQGIEEQRKIPGVLQSLERASRFYQQQLRDSPTAVDYLRSRGLLGQTAKRFGLGYAPDSWRGLEAEFAEYGAEELVQSGLVITSEAGEQKSEGQVKRYDRFRGRVMFPIRNPKGQTIGFGGRVIGSGEPKYLNSPETPVFSKGNELYGLFEGRDAIRKANLVLVVEGYMDVVMLAQHGIENAVATLGTATTPNHLRKLIRLADRIVFSFDGDAAGRRAARRALETCLPVCADDKRFDFLFLPTEHDPDSFVQEKGKEAFNHAIDQALTLSEFLVEALVADCDMQTPEGRALFQAHARPLLQQLPLTIALRAQIMRRIASLVELPVDELERYLAAKPARPVSSNADSSDWRDGNSSSGEPEFAAGRKPWSKQRQSSVRRPLPNILDERIRILAATHPRLVHDWLEEHFSSAAIDVVLSDDELFGADLLAWFELIGRLPVDSTFATLVEAIRESDPDAAQALVGMSVSEVGSLGLDEARFEFRAALLGVQRKSISRRKATLVESGLKADEDRALYQRLVLLDKAVHEQMAALAASALDRPSAQKG